DALRSLQAAAGHRTEADHAGAEDDAGRAGADLGRVDRGPEAGGETAGEEAGAVERGLAGDHRQRDLRHHRVLGEGRRAHEVADLLAAAGEPGAAVRKVAAVLLLADREAE